LVGVVGVGVGLASPAVLNRGTSRLLRRWLIGRRWLVVGRGLLLVWLMCWRPLVLVPVVVIPVIVSIV